MSSEAAVAELLRSVKNKELIKSEKTVPIGQDVPLNVSALRADEVCNSSNICTAYRSVKKCILF